MIPWLAPMTEMVQFKFHILIRIWEKVEINSDMKCTNRNKLIKIFWYIVPDARKQSRIVTKNIRSYHLKVFKFVDPGLLGGNNMFWWTYNKVIFCYNICLSLLASWFLSDICLIPAFYAKNPAFYAKISAFYANIFLFSFHCAGNVHFRVPVGCL